MRDTISPRDKSYSVFLHHGRPVTGHSGCPRTFGQPTMFRPSLRCKPMSSRATPTKIQTTSTHKRASSCLLGQHSVSRYPSRFMVLCCQPRHGISPPVVPSGICHPNSCLPWGLEAPDSYYPRYLGHPAKPLCLRMNLCYQNDISCRTPLCYTLPHQWQTLLSELQLFE